MVRKKIKLKTSNLLSAQLYRLTGEQASRRRETVLVSRPMQLFRSLKLKVKVRASVTYCLISARSLSKNTGQYQIT